jgi:hypothetical protein
VVHAGDNSRGERKWCAVDVGDAKDRGIDPRVSGWFGTVGAALKRVEHLNNA